MRRRDVLRSILRGLPGLALLASWRGAAAAPATSRVRPGEPGWPTEADWERLRARSAAGSSQCARRSMPASERRRRTCARLFAELKNPYFLGDEPGLTQTLGWVDAWTSRPSVYAVAAESTDGRGRGGRLRPRAQPAAGGQGRRPQLPGHLERAGLAADLDAAMNGGRRCTTRFVADGLRERSRRSRRSPSGRARSGAQVYDAVTTGGGRYVQGGGCTDRRRRRADPERRLRQLLQGLRHRPRRACSRRRSSPPTARCASRTPAASPDLFWGLKGGGGGSLGRRHAADAAHARAAATSSARCSSTVRADVRRRVPPPGRADRRLLRRGACSIRTGASRSPSEPGNALEVVDGVPGPRPGGRPKRSGGRSSTGWPPRPRTSPSSSRRPSSPCRRGSFWDPAFLKQVPGPRPRRRPSGRAGGQHLLGQQPGRGRAGAARLPVGLAPGGAAGAGASRAALVDALVAAARHWRVSLHFNKGLAGAPAEAVAAARDTATNPAVLDAFALAISGADGPPAYPGIPGHEPDVAAARADAAAVGRAMDELRALVPAPAPTSPRATSSSTLAASAFWGPNYPRLLAVKRRATTPTASSSSTTASAARTGAPTGSRGSNSRSETPR